MRRHRLPFLLSAAVLTAIAAVVVIALLVFPHAHPRKTGRTVTDLAGRKVTVPETIRRIVAIGPGSLRFVAYLGVVDRIVGIEDFERRVTRDLYVRPYASTLRDSFLRLPVVGSGGPGALPDPERVLQSRPDVIVAVALDPALLDTIEQKTGVPTVYLSYGKLGVWRQEAQRSLSLLGEIVGKQKRAAWLNGYVASLEKDLKARTTGIRERPSAYFGGISYKGAQGLTSTEAGYPPGRLVGARNLADTLGKTGHFLVDKEKILAWNPDFIFVDAGSRLILDRDFDKSRGFYRLLKAARSGRVFSLLPYNYYNTNIELALLNAYFIGKTLFPDRFKDVDIEAKSREIMTAFLGVSPKRAIPAYRPLRFPDSGPIQWM